jgi:hypothetical protein
MTDRLNPLDASFVDAEDADPHLRRLARTFARRR